VAGHAPKVNNALLVRDRQTRKVDVRLLRKIVRALLNELAPPTTTELAIYIVDDDEMTRLNETYLRHKGSTDVLTFNYAVPGANGKLNGEVFVCSEVAVRQARRFRTTWQSELVRYVVHGILHLMGYDDHSSRDRRRMKKEENRWVRELASRFPLQRLGG